jgi:protein tyrosine phosphatase
LNHVCIKIILENKSYKHIYIDDHSRVILKTLPNDPSSDYINASYIDGFKINKLYIAAQGRSVYLFNFENNIENLLAPTDITLHDFIRMIWQSRIQFIIMLTRLFEDGKVKSR